MARRQHLRSRIDWRAFASGLPLGPLLTAVTFLVALETNTRLSDVALLTIVCAPTAAVALLAPVAAARGNSAARWIWTALGAALGTAVFVGTVLGLIAGFALLLSDPG